MKRRFAPEAVTPASTVPPLPTGRNRRGLGVYVPLKRGTLAHGSAAGVVERAKRSRQRRLRPDVRNLARGGFRGTADRSSGKHPARPPSAGGTLPRDAGVRGGRGS